MMRIENANAANRQEPQLAVRGFCHNRAKATREAMAGYDIRSAKHRRPYRLRWMGNPRVQLRPGDPHETTSRVKPDRISVIFHHPLNRIAGQPVLAGECENATVFEAAQSNLRRDPERAAPILVETAHPSRCQPFGACERGADLTVLKISNTTVSKTKP